MMPIPAPAVILPLPGSSVGQLCVDILRFHVPISLFEDPDQGKRCIPGIYLETQTPLV